MVANTKLRSAGQGHLREGIISDGEAFWKPTPAKRACSRNLVFQVGNVSEDESC
jgi:hypothetical protein